MTIFQALLRRLQGGFGTSDWTDAGLLDGGDMAIRRPINIQRVTLNRPCRVMVGDNLVVSYQEDYVTKWCTPELPITRSMVADSCTKFEVIDEFGVDVGIGFVIGELKKG